MKLIKPFISKKKQFKKKYHKTHKYLWVYTDRTLTYQKHLEKTPDKLKKRNSLIQKLTRTSWGASPSVSKISTLTLSYSFAEYCAPVWSHSSHTPKIDFQLHQTM